MSSGRYKSRSRVQAKVEAKAKPGTFLDRFGLLIVGIAVVAFIAGGLYFLAHRDEESAASAYDRAIADCVKDRTRVIDTSGTQSDPTSDCVRETPVDK